MRTAKRNRQLAVVVSRRPQADAWSARRECRKPFERHAASLARTIVAPRSLAMLSMAASASGSRAPMTTGNIWLDDARLSLAIELSVWPRYFS